MNERLSYFNFDYDVISGNFMGAYKPDFFLAVRNTIPANFKYTKEDIEVYAPKGSKSEYYVSIPESSPYFNIPLLTSKLDNIPGGKHSSKYILPTVKQFVEWIAKQ